MNIAGTLVRAAQANAARPAVSHGNGVVLDYGELAEQVGRLAGAMRGSLGLERGDRVALVMTNCVAYLEVLYACWHAGLAAVPVNARLHPREFAYILEDSGARLVVASEDLVAAVGEAVSALSPEPRVLVAGSDEYRSRAHGDPVALAEVGPGDLAWLFYTSGTTGRPKGAMLTHRNMYSMTMNYLADVDVIDPAGCMIHAAPMSHGSGLYALPHVARGANNVIPESGGFNVDEALALIRTWPGCSFFLAPTMVTRLVNSDALATADLTNLKTIVYGGAPMYLADTLRALEVIGNRFVQIYGQGEAPMTISVLPKRLFEDRGHPRWHERLASAGIARTDVEVRIVDEDGEALGPGEVGEITCRGDVVMAGYWNNPGATAAALRDGWLWTGDVGAMDSEGFLTLKDRSKDMIISGGTNIYPREIEEVLLTHAAVFECAVIGRPHADWGEEVVAFVVPVPGEAVTADELDRLCLESIARFKRPRAYRFVEGLAKNNYGKILKTVLRDRLAGEDGNRPAP